MAHHDIDVRIPSEIWVGNTDLEVAVYGDGRLVGQLHISRGTIDWVPSKGRSRYRLRWERFDEVMVRESAQRATITAEKTPAADAPRLTRGEDVARG
jgi:hypothetical protein